MADNIHYNHKVNSMMAYSMGHLYKLEMEQDKAPAHELFLWVEDRAPEKEEGGSMVVGRELGMVVVDIDNTTYKDCIDSIMLTADYNTIHTT
jgi:hypothetical protein